MGREGPHRPHRRTAALRHTGVHHPSLIPGPFSGPSTSRAAARDPARPRAPTPRPAPAAPPLRTVPRPVRRGAASPARRDDDHGPAPPCPSSADVISLPHPTPGVAEPSVIDFPGQMSHHAVEPLAPQELTDVISRWSRRGSPAVPYGARHGPVPLGTPAPPDAAARRALRGRRFVRSRRKNPRPNDE
ncbi:protein of unknown function (plasmid) [Streptantibioticus cattleyicolor NRRL 8057 = DSM 46488]|nr:protein of unknown function [Streptantibioticus cattleyicolor NRRL 8057 = DSM 46488]